MNRKNRRKYRISLKMRWEVCCAHVFTAKARGRKDSLPMGFDHGGTGSRRFRFANAITAKTERLAADEF